MCRLRGQSSQASTDKGRGLEDEHAASLGSTVARERRLTEPLFVDRGEPPGGTRRGSGIEEISRHDDPMRVQATGATDAETLDHIGKSLAQGLGAHSLFQRPTILCSHLFPALFTRPKFPSLLLCAYDPCCFPVDQVRSCSPPRTFICEPCSRGYHSGGGAASLAGFALPCNPDHLPPTEHQEFFLAGSR